MRFNQDSGRGLKATPYNCSILAMDTAGLIPDDTGLSRTGMNVGQLKINIMKQAHVKEVIPPSITERINNPCRIRTFAARHPEGIFIVFLRGHFAAIIDGVIMNSRRNQVVRRAWKISKKEPGEK